MATAEERFEKPHNGDENATNGDTSRLEYSGLSEDNLNTSETNESIAKEIAQDFHEDLDEHGAPVPSAKAIKREINESHTFSDDEFPKTLTTLETVKKPVQSTNESDEIEICPIEADEDEFEEEPILLEVYNADEEHKETESADLQKTVTPESNRRERKQQFTLMANNVRNKLQTPKVNSKSANDDTIVTPNKPIPAQSPGTIEIPRELITADASIISPIIINHMKNPSDNSDDLIAILEGDDNGSVNAGTVEHYELSLPSGATNGDQKVVLTAEEEREIAMEQIMSLPKKKKGRPKLNQALKAARDAKLTKKNKNALVSSLVSEWDENDAKNDEATETEIVVEIRPQKKQAIVEPVAEPTFRRSRVIKKKIIWDPDAPETAINYASLAHTSGAGPIKRPRKSIAKKSETSDDNEMADISLPPTPLPKKKKTSEIDKLLGDEGAANMLNSLHQGNNNNNQIDGTSPVKIPRAKSIKVEPCNVQTTSTVTAKGKATKSKEVKEQSPQKQPQTPNKKSGTPKSVATGKKRGAKETSESWDYIYKSRPDDCMIIRRRSNSSYSSTASLTRTSIDLPNAPLIMDLDASDNDHEIEAPNKRSRSNKDKSQFEFAKPKAKRASKFDNDTKYTSSFDEAKNSTVDINNVFSNHKPGKSTKTEEIDFGAIPIKLENGNDKDTSFTQISLCRFENFTQIILHANDPNSKSLLTAQVSYLRNSVRTVTELMAKFPFDLDAERNRDSFTFSRK